MRIARIESFQVPPRWIFVRLQTDDGIVGWGEAIVPKRARAVRGAIADLADNLMGASANAIEDAWQRMFRGAFFRRGPILMTAIAAIEQALWDVKGQRYGLPIYEFLGGKVRNSVQAYAWIGGDVPADVVKQVKVRQAQGYRAVKMNATGASHYLAEYQQIDGVIERVAAVRAATGPNFGIALDFHGRVHRAMVKTLLTELMPYRLLWVEEALLPEHGDQLRDLASIPIPLAAGERIMDRWGYKTVLEQRALSIIQPDVSLTGIHELEKIARMAEAYDVVVAPHCPNGPISLAATLMVLGAIPNAVWQEHSRGLHYHQGYESLPPGELETYLMDQESLALHNGNLPILDAPGLGIAVNEEVVRDKDQARSLADPVWRNPDGTLAEW